MCVASTARSQRGSLFEVERSWHMYDVAMSVCGMGPWQSARHGPTLSFHDLAVERVDERVGRREEDARSCARLAS